MAALILSLKTRDTPNDVNVKLRANMIEVGGLRLKFNINSEQTNFDFKPIIEESTSKKNLKMEDCFGTCKISATTCTALSRFEQRLHFCIFADIRL